MARSRRPFFVLYDLYESDEVGVFDLLSLLGVDSLKGRRATALWSLPLSSSYSDVALLSLRSWLLFRGSRRLEAALSALDAEGWTRDESGGRHALAVAAPEDLEPKAAERRLLEALRAHVLWAVCRSLGTYLLGREPEEAWTDLRRRAELRGRAAPSLIAADPLAVVRELRDGTARPGRVLDLLPGLRDRLVAALDMALGLRGDETVLALCPDDPAPFRIDPPDAPQALEDARNNRRVLLSRVRSRIDDGLVDGHPGLRTYVDELRVRPLPAPLEEVRCRWSSDSSQRDVRRVHEMARLVALAGRADGAGALEAALFEGGAPVRGRLLAQRQASLTRATARPGVAQAAGALGAVRDPRDLLVFLCRHVVWRRSEERPGLETLGTGIGGAAPGEAAYLDAAGRLHRARRAIAEALSDEGVNGDSAGRRAGPRPRRGGAALSLAPGRRQELRAEARRALDDLAGGPTTIWQQLGAAVDAWLRPRPAGGLAWAGVTLSGPLRVGDAHSLCIDAGADEAARPVLVRVVDDRATVVHPRHAGELVPLAVFPEGAGGRLLPLVLDEPSGAQRWLVYLLPEDVEPSVAWFEAHEPMGVLDLAVEEELTPRELGGR